MRQLVDVPLERKVDEPPRVVDARVLLDVGARARGPMRADQLALDLGMPEVEEVPE